MQGLSIFRLGLVHIERQYLTFDGGSITVLYDSQILCTDAYSSFHLLPGRVVIEGASTSSPTPMIDGCHSVMPTVKRITMCEFRICAKVLFTVSR